MRVRHGWLRGLAAALLLAGLTACSTDVDEGAGDWTGFGRTPGADSYSPLARIDRASVARLGLAWAYDLEPGQSVTEPVAANGILYLATRYSSVTALDAVTGRLIWHFDPKATEATGGRLRGWGIRGLAYDEGRIFVGSHDGRLLALDARSGDLLWSAQTTDPKAALSITGPPRVFGGKVLIGQAGGDSGHERGYVTCYDTATGRRLWRFYTVPGPHPEDEVQAMAAKTWVGGTSAGGAGGMVWHGITYDTEFNRFYITPGNPPPKSVADRRDGKGDNLFTASIVALDAETGKYVWHYQLNPGDEWDYDVGGDLIPTTLNIGGRPRKVLLSAPKNGFFYVLDRTNGKLISAKPFARQNWATRIDLATGRPVENPAIRHSKTSPRIEVWPGIAGAHAWLPMAYSPKTRLVYIPVMDRPSILGENKDVSPDRPGADISYLEAWDPVAQKAIWRVENPGLSGGGAMATGGDLVFQGQADRMFNAYDAKSGERLWRFNAQAPVIAPPITYQVNGVQYVTVITGYGLSLSYYGRSNYAHQALDLDYRTMQRRVLTFALGGRATLPPAPAALPRVPATDPDFRADAARAEAGKRLYSRSCSACHGLDVIAAGAAPDLRWSGVSASGPAFQAIVQNGMLLQRGMPRFEELTPAQLEDIRFFVRTRAHEPD